MLPPYLIVHDGSETKDADVDIILLAHQTGVLQSPAPRERAIPGGEVAVGEGSRSAHHHPDSRLPQQQQKRGKEDLAPIAERGEGAEGRALDVSPPCNKPLSVTTQDHSFIICAQTIQAQQSSKIQ